jgi:hypothetical protein
MNLSQTQRKAQDTYTAPLEVSEAGVLKRRNGSTVAGGVNN